MWHTKCLVFLHGYTLGRNPNFGALFPTSQKSCNQNLKIVFVNFTGSPKQFFNRPSFDSVFFDAFSNSIFFRDPRKAQRPNRRPPPVYPPRDPFGTTEYIPLPPSNPGHALPLTHENPHFKPGRGGRGQRFRGRLPRKAFFHGLPSFLYDSSNDFRTHENQVVSAIKSVP